MNGPLAAAICFAMALVLGAALGLFYGFLRPLRQKHPHIADLLFLPAMVYAWLYLSFAVCRGDVRLVYTAGLFAGAVLWEISLGRLLRPVFRGFWRVIAWPFKKIFAKIGDFVKILFAIGKKKSTIK